MSKRETAIDHEVNVNATQVILHGTLRTDGTLELNGTPTLAPGPVEVLIRTIPAAQIANESWWEYLQRARAEMLAQGGTFRTREDIDTDRAQQRADDEARRQAL